MDCACCKQQIKAQAYLCKTCLAKQLTSKIVQARNLKRQNQVLKQKLEDGIKYEQSMWQKERKVRQKLALIVDLKQQIQRTRVENEKLILANKMIKETKLGNRFELIKYAKSVLKDEMSKFAQYINSQSQQQGSSLTASQLNKSMVLFSSEREQLIAKVRDWERTRHQWVKRLATKIPLKFVNANVTNKFFVLDNSLWLPISADLWSCVATSPQQQQQLDVLYCDANIFSAAMGYIVLLCNSLAWFLGIHLPYTMQYFGSRSTIKDEDKSYPLFFQSPSVTKPLFETAIRYLNVNVHHICALQGIVIAPQNVHLFGVNLKSILISPNLGKYVHDSIIHPLLSSGPLTIMCDENKQSLANTPFVVRSKAQCNYVVHPQTLKIIPVDPLQSQVKPAEAVLSSGDSPQVTQKKTSIADAVIPDYLS